MTKPYTYAIRNKSTGQRYYGVRYAKNCNPNDLWVSYFTSSKHVKNLIERYGLSDFEVSVRKVFETREKAIEWEHRFLKRIDVLNNPEWINYSVGGVLTVTKSQARIKNYFKTGRKRSETEIFNRKSNYEKTVWINCDDVNKLIKSSDLPYYLSLGYIVGRTDSFQTDAFKRACKKRVGENNPAFGRKRPDLVARNTGKFAWVTKNDTDKKIELSLIEDFLSEGWIRGRYQSGGKLTATHVREIKTLISDGIENIDIAARFGVSKALIVSIRKGKCWSSVE